MASVAAGVEVTLGITTKTSAMNGVAVHEMLAPVASSPNDDELLRALRERATALVDAEGPNAKPYLCASPDEIADAESRLGFRLPPPLRRVYEIGNGGLGPGLHGLLPIGEGDDTLAIVYRGMIDSTYVPQPGEPGFDQYPWPKGLLPICDGGCAIWSCLDCRGDDGVIVTASNGEPFATTGRTLRSWLSAWLEGVDLFEEMFEPGPSRIALNPFTKERVTLRGQGKPRGMRWP
jgi:hypothetical protein